MAVSILVGVLLLVGCSGPIAPRPTATATPDPVTLKLNWFHSPQFLGFYVALANGYYAEEGLDLTIEPKLETDWAIPNQVADGTYDFGVGGAIPRTQAEGSAVTAIASIFQFGPEAFFARADSGMVTPADMAGRRVVVKSPGWERLLVDLLARQDLTLDDIEAVPGGFDMTPFFEGEVEVWGGYLNDEVVRARQQGVDLITWPVYEYGVPSQAQTVTVGQETLASDPDLVARFLRASLRGWEWAVENQATAVDIMLELYPELADEREFLQASFDATIPLIRPPGIQIGSIDCEEWAADPLFDDLESTAGLCTTAILDAVRAQD